MKNWMKAVAGLAGVALLASAGACGTSRSSSGGGGVQVPRTPLM